MLADYLLIPIIQKERQQRLERQQLVQAARASGATASAAGASSGPSSASASALWPLECARRSAIAPSMRPARQPAADGTQSRLTEQRG